jgi:hypothetical protein
LNINDRIVTYFNVNWHLLDISVSAIFSSDEIKNKVEKRFNELGDMCERGEIEAEEAYELFKKFEDEMVIESPKIMEAELLRRLPSLMRLLFQTRKMTQTTLLARDRSLGGKHG